MDNDNELVKNDYPSQKVSCEEIDFVTHWQHLHDVISTGERLREEKQIPSPQEYDVIDVDFIKKPKKALKCHRPRPNKLYQPDYTKPLSMQNFLHRNLCSKISNTVQHKIKTRKLKQNNKTNKCPMRIMELAEPSKRQCLETLKQKSHSLPDFMLDRLRKQLRNQKPVIQITEALTCFKIKKSRKKRPTRTPKNVIVRRSMTEIKYFCGIFGAHIARRLNKVIKTEDLSDELQRLSKIVSDEIRRITVGKNKCGFTKGRQYDSNVQDVARKVAIWIALILEDSAEKMLEEEMRELEEEEGPVLDWLDDLFDSVMDTCEPYPPDDHSSNSSTSGDHFDDAVDKESVGAEDDTISHTPENITNDQLAAETIESILEGIAKTVPDSKAGADDFDEAFDETENENEPDANTDIESVDKTYLSQKSSNDDLFMSKTIDDETETSQGKKNQEFINEENEEGFEPGNYNENTTRNIQKENELEWDNTETVSDLGQKSMQESEDFNDLEEEEQDRTVKFSPVADQIENSKYSSKSREDILSSHKHNVRRYIANNHNSLSWSQSTDNVVPLNLQPPNEHLLSQADEVWPSHIAPFERGNALDVVNKSVTSLGNISEREPRQAYYEESRASEHFEKLIGEVQLRDE